MNSLISPGQTCLVYLCHQTLTFLREVRCMWVRVEEEGAFFFGGRGLPNMGGTVSDFAGCELNSIKNHL